MAVMGALGDLFSGPVLGWIFLAVGVGFLVLWNRKRHVTPDVDDQLVIWPRRPDRPSSSVLIQLIRDAYKQGRPQGGTPTKKGKQYLVRQAGFRQEQDIMASKYGDGGTYPQGDGPKKH